MGTDVEERWLLWDKQMCLIRQNITSPPSEHWRRKYLEAVKKCGLWESWCVLSLKSQPNSRNPFSHCWRAILVHLPNWSGSSRGRLGVFSAPIVTPQNASSVGHQQNVGNLLWVGANGSNWHQTSNNRSPHCEQRLTPTNNSIMGLWWTQSSSSSSSTDFKNRRTSRHRLGVLSLFKLIFGAQQVHVWVISVLNCAH